MKNASMTASERTGGLNKTFSKRKFATTVSGVVGTHTLHDMTHTRESHSYTHIF